MSKPINNYQHHTITEDGVVTNLKTGKVKSVWKSKVGYYCVDIQEFGKAKKHYLHRLLCEHFIPNPENKRTVNHIDGDKTNNRLSNLEWATDSENIKHAYDNDLNRSKSKHELEFYEKVLTERFLKGENITSISKSSDVQTTLTRTSIWLRKAARSLSLEDEYDKELKRQKLVRQKKANRTSYAVQMIDLQSNEVIKTFNSLSDAAKELGKTTSGPISNVISGRQKSAYGYKWVRV